MELIVEHLAFSYPNKPLLTEVSFHLKKGEIGTLIGASGSGKSTLFKTLTGLLPLQKGNIQAHGMAPPLSYQSMAYMMQQDLLLPWRTVFANVQLAIELGPSSPASPQEIIPLLKEVGLDHCLEMYPEDLSGGMRQRVALARALLQRRPLLLLDEPFGALDVGLREQMYQLLRQIRERYQTTILMVTHDFRDALSLSDRLFLLARGKIYKEWQISPSMRQDIFQMAQLQQELQILLQERF